MVDLQLKGLVATDTLHFLFDGPAPLAKYCTQVSRRIKGKSDVPSATNVVTPGTSFMSELNNAMLFYLALRASRSPPHSQTRYFLSGKIAWLSYLYLLTCRERRPWRRRNQSDSLHSHAWISFAPHLSHRRQWCWYYSSKYVITVLLLFLTV